MLHPTAIQTEEFQPGDVIPHWYRERSATVLRVSKVPDGVLVKTDSTPSHRMYRRGRTVNVLREA